MVESRSISGWILVPTLLLVVAIGWLVVGDWQITSEHQIALDLLFRSSLGEQDVLVYQLSDPSSFAWAEGVDRWLHDILRQGQLPLWEPLQGGGYSPLTQASPGVFFPLRWIAAIFPVAQVPSVLALLSMWAAWVGMFLLGVQIGLGRFSAMLAGLTWILSGVFTSQLLYDGSAILLFLPWLIWVEGQLKKGATRRRVVASSVLFSAAFLSGHPMVLSVVFLGAGLAFLLRRVGQKGFVRNTLYFGGSSVWGLALAAFAILPFVIALSTGWTYKTETLEGASWLVASWDEWGKWMAALAFDATGPNTLGDSPRFYHYQGLPLCVFSIGGAIAAWRQTNVRWVAGFLGIAILLAVPGPWMRPLASLSPLSWVRNYYYFSLLSFGTSLAGAYGADVLLRLPALARFRGLLKVALLLVLPGILALHTTPLIKPHRARPLPDSEALLFLQERLDGARVTGSFGQVNLPNTSAWTGIPDLRMMVTTMDRRYHQWWEWVDPDVMLHSYPTTRLTPRPESGLLGAFGVRFFLEGKLPHHVFLTSLRPGDPFGSFLPGPPSSAAPVVFEDGFLRIYELPHVAPRLFVPAEVVTVRTINEAASWLMEHAPRVPDAVVVEAAIEVPVARGEVELLEAVGREVRIRSRLETGGLVVWNERFETGWEAWTEDARAEIVPVNVLARGVIVPAGEHVVVLRYTPPGFKAGVFISSLAVVALLLLLLWRRGSPLKWSSRSP